MGFEGPVSLHASCTATTVGTFEKTPLLFFGNPSAAEAAKVLQGMVAGQASRAFTSSIWTHSRGKKYGFECQSG